MIQASFLTPLTPTELDELRQHESTIERGLKTFVEVGNALADIRDRRLYRERYGTFEDYCQERWGIVASRARQLIGAAKTVTNVTQSANRTISPPANEAQARPLTKLPADEQASVWQEAVETAPNGKVTARHVEETVKNHLPKGGNKTNRPGDIYTPQGMDACQTPPYALDPLLPHLAQFKTLWEPACGEMYLVKTLFDSGFDVIPSDILEGQNFFEYEPDRPWDCLVTNPPYSIKYQWIERCYELGKPFALLMPVETLGAKSAQTFFKEDGVGVIFLDRRVNFKMPVKGWEDSAAQFPVAWFTWGLGLDWCLEFGAMGDASAT